MASHMRTRTVDAHLADRRGLRGPNGPCTQPSQRAVPPKRYRGVSLHTAGSESEPARPRLPRAPPLPRGPLPTEWVGSRPRGEACEPVGLRHPPRRGVPEPTQAQRSIRPPVVTRAWPRSRNGGVHGGRPRTAGRVCRRSCSPRVPPNVTPPPHGYDSELRSCPKVARMLPSSSRTSCFMNRGSTKAGRVGPTSTSLGAGARQRRGSGLRCKRFDHLPRRPPWPARGDGHRRTAVAMLTEHPPLRPQVSLLVFLGFGLNS